MFDRNADLHRVLPDYRAWLYRVAIDMLGAGHPDLDDLVQEGWVAMWRALGTYDPAKGALPTWLTGAARLRMADCARGHGQAFGREPTRAGRSAEATVSTDALADAGDATVELLLQAPDLAEQVMFAYHSGEIAAAIDRLSPAQARYVRARFFCGLDPSARTPEMRALNALVPELKRGSSLWLGTTGQRGARDRLHDDLSHLRELVDA